MRADDGRVVSNFIVQALKNENITVYGSGKQTRSFCYVEDLINGIIAMMNSDNSIIGPFNLGNPTEFTVLELAEKIIAMIGSESKIEFCPLPQDDPRKRKPDIENARLLLGWEPLVTLDEGIERTVDYFRQKRKGKNEI